MTTTCICSKVTLTFCSFVSWTHWGWPIPRTTSTGSVDAVTALLKSWHEPTATGKKVRYIGMSICKYTRHKMIHMNHNLLAVYSTSCTGPEPLSVKGHIEWRLLILHYYHTWVYDVRTIHWLNPIYACFCIRTSTYTGYSENTLPLAMYVHCLLFQQYTNFSNLPWN